MFDELCSEICSGLSSLNKFSLVILCEKRDC